MTRLAVVLVSLIVITACARTGDDFEVEVLTAGDASAYSDVPSVDVRTNESEDVSATLDVSVGQDDELRPAPPIRTPERSEATELLYCEMDNGHLVQAALRAGACLDASVAGVLDDASRGFVAGEVLWAGYAPVTYGNCDFLRCLNNATNCAEAQLCEDARTLGPCDGFTSTCDDDVLYQCVWNGEEYENIAVQDCTRQGAVCEELRAERAGCFGERTDEPCGFYGSCDGDSIRRCTGVEPGETASTQVVIPCGELIEGGTCIETPVGGEAPGAACAVPDFECTNSFAEGFECGRGGSLSICLYGSILEIDCQDYGYDGCVEEGFFGARCL